MTRVKKGATVADAAMAHAISQSHTLRDFEIVAGFAATGETGSGAVVIRFNERLSNHHAGPERFRLKTALEQLAVPKKQPHLGNNSSQALLTDRAMPGSKRARTNVRALLPLTPEHLYYTS
jgi:hypothetical protein